MARRDRRRAAVAALVRRPPSRARRYHGRNDGRDRLRRDCDPVVALLKPSALGRTCRRDSVSRDRCHRDKAHRAPVYSKRNDGNDATRLLYSLLLSRPCRVGARYSQFLDKS